MEKPAAVWSKVCSLLSFLAPCTEPLGDAAHVKINGHAVAVTTDSFVVKPLVFPGGSIGELAINGTVNDLAVSGARAEAIVVTFILEAGLPTEVLEARSAGHGRCGCNAPAFESSVAIPKSSSTAKPIACTSRPPVSARRYRDVEINPRSVRPGDKVLLSGPIGDHGITILLARGELDIEGDLAVRYAVRASPWSKLS